MLSGDNGLLKRAGDARDDTVVGQEKEQVELAYVSAAVKKLGNDVDKDDLQDELDISVGENKTEVTDNDNNTLNVLFSDTKHNYIVDNNGNVKKSTQLRYTDIFVALYTDGTLLFSNTKQNIENNKLVEGWEIINIKDDLYYEEYFNGDTYVEGKYSKWDGNTDITRVEIANEIVPHYTAYWFENLENLAEIKNIENINTSNVIDMSRMFSGCSSLTNLDLSSFNTDKVSNMEYMFYSCSSLNNLNISNFKTNNVTNMSAMFEWCTSLNSLDISNFRTNNVTDMHQMFDCCSGLSSLNFSKWDTSKVTDMSNMFGSMTITTLDISSFDSSSVELMAGMFAGCSQLSSIQVSSNWNTQNVTNGNQMFQNCTSLVGGNGTIFNWRYAGVEYAHIDGGTSNPGYFTLKTN